MRPEYFYIKKDGKPELVNGYVGELECSKGVSYIGLDRREQGWAITELVTGEQIATCNALDARKLPKTDIEDVCRRARYAILTTSRENVKKFRSAIRYREGSLPEYLKEIISKRKGNRQ